MLLGEGCRAKVLTCTRAVFVRAERISQPLTIISNNIYVIVLFDAVTSKIVTESDSHARFVSVRALGDCSGLSSQL